MIAILIFAFVGLYIMVQSGAQRIEDTNAQIAEEMGDAYNPDAAGHPYRDALIITLLVVLLAAFVVVPTVGRIVPLPNDTQVQQEEGR